MALGEGMGMSSNWGVGWDGVWDVAGCRVGLGLRRGEDGKVEVAVFVTVLPGVASLCFFLSSSCGDVFPRVGSSIGATL